MESFERNLEILISENENYRIPNEKGKVVTNKKHPVYSVIVNKVPLILKEKLAEKKIENINYIRLKGSTGDGLIGDSYWIALLDERITTSTTNGIYIVLLFDRPLDNIYLTIAFGTENINLTQIKSLASQRRATFLKQIQTDENLAGFSTSDIYLGNGRARKFAESVCIHKKYNLKDLTLDDLANDINILNELYYKYLYEHYLEEIPEDKTKNNGRRIIKSDKYNQLRMEKDKKNKETGNLAEEYIFNLEKEKLIKLGLFELSKEVKWIAKTEDGHGYDIVSFFPDGTKKHIEVKGSTLSQDDFTFYLSAREKLVAEELQESYVLILVENVTSNNIKVFEEIINPIPHIGKLIPTNYKGVINRKTMMN